MRDKEIETKQWHREKENKRKVSLGFFAIYFRPRRHYARFLFSQASVDFPLGPRFETHRP